MLYHLFHDISKLIFNATLIYFYPWKLHTPIALVNGEFLIIPVVYPGFREWVEGVPGALEEVFFTREIKNLTFFIHLRFQATFKNQRKLYNF